MCALAYVRLCMFLAVLSVSSLLFSSFFHSLNPADNYRLEDLQRVYPY